MSDEFDKEEIQRCKFGWREFDAFPEVAYFNLTTGIAHLKDGTERPMKPEEYPY